MFSLHKSTSHVISSFNKFLFFFQNRIQNNLFIWNKNKMIKSIDSESNLIIIIIDTKKNLIHSMHLELLKHNYEFIYSFNKPFIINQR